MVYKSGFIGCGNMASAIIKGSVSSGYINTDDICVFDIDKAKAESLGLAVKSAGDIRELTEFSDFIFLCVKPQNITSVLDELSELPLKDKCIVSIAAGVKSDKIRSHLGGVPVIRVMPNLALMYKEGASALTSNGADDERFDYILGIFNACGKACALPEKDFDAVTALSGSGPAFCFRFVRELAAAAVENGMNERDAMLLAVQTIKGSAAVLESSPLKVDELIKMVSSKGGTTVAGLSALDENGFDKAVRSAVDAACRRSKELG